MKKTKNQYYTYEGVEVTKRIKDGLTTFLKGIGIEEEIKSYDIARKKRTYPYPIYDEYRNQVGYGIPK